jgi:DNA-damage-inducible protein J
MCFGKRGGIQKMAKTAMTHARLTPEIKEKAENILKELGISISAAYEMFYRQIIAHQGIPFDFRIPNKDTLQAMRDARNGKGERYESVEKMFKDLKI